jgi:hypothetical protein
MHQEGKWPKWLHLPRRVYYKLYIEQWKEVERDMGDCTIDLDGIVQDIGEDTEGLDVHNFVWLAKRGFAPVVQPQLFPVQWETVQLRHSRWPGVAEKREVMKCRIQKDIDRGFVQVVDPERLESGSLVHGMGWVPKGLPAPPGEIRLISNFKPGINQFCPPVTCWFPPLSEWIDFVEGLGQGAIIFGFDFAHWYHQWAILPKARKLFLVKFDDSIYCSNRMQFGWGQAVGLCTWASQIVQRALLRQSQLEYIFVYMDDFSSGMRLDSPGDRAPTARELGRANAILRSALKWNVRRRLAFDQEKCFLGQVVKVLGFVWDTRRRVVYLPSEKMEALKDLVDRVVSGTGVSGADLTKLAGKLAHLCRVLLVGRAFLQEIWERYKEFEQIWLVPDVKWTAGMKSELKWWQVLLRSWTGASMWTLSTEIVDVGDIGHLFTDASKIGAGAWIDDWAVAAWFKMESQLSSSNRRELFAIWLAVKIFSTGWRGKRIVFHTDNKTAMAWLTGMHGPVAEVRMWIREVAFLAVVRGFEFRIVHIPGRENVWADKLSRLKKPADILEAVDERDLWFKALDGKHHLHECLSLVRLYRKDVEEEFGS